MTMEYLPDVLQSDWSTFSETKEDLITITIENIHQEIIKTEISEDDIKKAILGFNEFFIKKENYFISAINNLIRKTNFLELYQQVLENQISEDEFHDEITRESKKYTIEIRELENPTDIRIIWDIVRKVDLDLKEFSINEISELFSTDISKFSESIANYISK